MIAILLCVLVVCSIRLYVRLVVSIIIVISFIYSSYVAVKIPAFL
jgi:hypothetical protein